MPDYLSFSCQSTKTDLKLWLSAGDQSTQKPWTFPEHLRAVTQCFIRGLVVNGSSHEWTSHCMCLVLILCCKYAC